MRFRSLLYVPASEERFIAKAHTRVADAIILDLEDSVALSDKDASREKLSDSIARVGQSGATVFVRINADIETALKDAKAAALGGAFGLYVSKANITKLSKLNVCLDTFERGHAQKPIALVALIEDPAAVLDAQNLAKQPRVIALTVGGEDIANEMGAQPDPDVLRFPRQLVHYAAKASGHLSFGLFRTVANYSDIEAIAAAAREAKRFGFDGASCVHPSAVAILNDAFAPSPEEIAWAKSVVSAANEIGKAAFSFEGQMVDAPVLARARQIIDQDQY